MKKENCPFCAHRWIRKSNESPIKCPKCHTKYQIDKKYNGQRIIEIKGEDR